MRLRRHRSCSSSNRAKRFSPGVSTLLAATVSIAAHEVDKPLIAVGVRKRERSGLSSHLCSQPTTNQITDQALNRAGLHHDVAPSVTHILAGE